MISTLLWFVFIILLALLATLAIKFITLRVILAIILYLPISLSIVYCLLRQPPIRGSAKVAFTGNITIGGDGGSHWGDTLRNTIEAFNKSKKEGGDFIQMDVQITLDSIGVVYANGTAVSIANESFTIAETNWADLKRVRLMESGKIMSLEEALQWAEDNEMRMLWRLGSFNTNLIKVLSKKLADSNLHSRVAITSSNPLVVWFVRFNDPAALTGFSWGSNHFSLTNGFPTGGIATQWFFNFADAVYHWGTRSMLLPGFMGVDLLLTSCSDVDEQLVADAATESIQVVVSGCTNRRQLAYMRAQLSAPVLLDDVRLATMMLSLIQYSVESLLCLT
ncbi:unnamed protein product [Caenorhabditis auriculariae]|uniref:GP-PDE domain-containing protein n=1 Tax=Caenorhabditis auriculariae TaxID=2777116 RepID=A0A8S1H1I8_9PELO|nr:unnamed protein product [Caenorhabditis auriculariae]